MRSRTFTLGALSWGVLSYFIVLKTGLTERTVWSDEYVHPASRSWLDRINISKLTREPYNCEPATLVPGETYRTLNDAFSYTVKDVVHPRSHKRYSSASYTGTRLSTCTVDTISIRAPLSIYEMTFETTISCPLVNPGDQVLILSLSSRVSHETGTDHIIFNTTTRPLSTILPRIVEVFNSDLYSRVVSAGEIEQIFFGSPGGMANSMYFEGVLKKESGIKYNKGFIRGGTGGMGYPDAIQFIPKHKYQAIENYIRVLWSAILTDLGAESDSNVLTDGDLLNAKVPTGSSVWDIKKSFKWPLDAIEPTRLNVQHRCTVSKLKPKGLFFTDLFVGVAFVLTTLVLSGLVATRTHLFTKESLGAKAGVPPVKV